MDIIPMSAPEFDAWHGLAHHHPNQKKLNKMSGQRSVTLRRECGIHQRLPLACEREATRARMTMTTMTTITTMTTWAMKVRQAATATAATATAAKWADCCLHTIHRVRQKEYRHQHHNHEAAVPMEAEPGMPYGCTSSVLAVM